ncbi:D-glucuronyl C5-epimerase family protein [Pseudomonas sp. NyZ704]|nr:D-glucuronyl C5-epimerase family protein [Pseudomonas sp. NyZ704]
MKALKPISILEKIKLMINKRFLLSIIALITLLLSNYSYSIDVMEKSDDALKQYLWSSSEFNKLPFSEIIERGDPLQASWYVWNKYKRNKDTKEASLYLDNIIEKWDLNREDKLTYKYSYNDLAEGWWSSMDMTLLPLVLISVGEKTANKEYLTIANKLISQAVKSPIEGGSLWPDEGDGCWFSEYSWQGMTKDQEYYVMNGHLFSLTSIKLLADALNNAEAKAAYECGLKGTKAMAASFLNDGNWPLYMLYPETINPPHYLIFEAIQFAGLYDITGDAFYAAQRENRSAALAKYYPIYNVKNTDGEFKFFSALGPPHPYLHDIFDNEIICTDLNKTSSLSRIIGEAKNNRFFYKAITSNAQGDEKCSVYSKYLGVTFKLYETQNFISADDNILNPLPHSIETLFDAKEKNGAIIIDPSIRSSPEGQVSYIDTEGRIKLSFESQELTDNSMIAIEIVSDTRLPIMVTYIYEEKQITRYFVPIEKDQTSLLVISHVGFENANLLSKVSSITITILTDKLTHNANMRVKNLYSLKNQYDLFKLLSENKSEMLMAAD